MGETGDPFPGFGDRRPLTLYAGLKGARSELTEMEEFRFEGPRGGSRPSGSGRPEKFRSGGDEAGPTMVSIPSPGSFGRSDGGGYKELSKREPEAAHPLCWNESTGPVEGGNAGGSVPDLSGGPCGEGSISFWNTSRNGDWRRRESRPGLSDTCLGELERLELVEVTEDRFCEGSIKTEGSKAIAGFIDCRFAARDVGGCKESFKPLVEALAGSFINTCRGRTPLSRLVR